MNAVVLGAIAGAAGTLALDVASYGDMAVRGRAASDLPAEVIRRAAKRVGVGALGKSDEDSGPELKARRSALGALSGYGVGVGIGMLYGALRPLTRGVPLPLAALALGALAMAAADVPAARLQATNPRDWGAAGWISDAIPHLAYGLVTAAVLEGLLEDATLAASTTIAIVEETTTLDPGIPLSES